MKINSISNSNKTYSDEEVEVMKRIVKHARRDGKTYKEALEQVAYRLERTVGAVTAFWHANVSDEFKEYINRPWTPPENNLSNPFPRPDENEEHMTVMAEAFAKVAEGYAVDDLPFADAGDYTGDIDPHPEQYQPPEEADMRYNVPRLSPKASETDVENAIDDNAIYSQTRDEMLNAQRRQVAYGLDKYPEPLNADTWTIIETIDHIISETADKLHYLTMLKIKLQQGTEE